MDLVEDNIDRLALVSEFDMLSLGRNFVDRNRDEYWDQVSPDKFLPIWHEAYGTAELDALASRYDRIGVGEDAPKNRLNSLVSKYGTKLHGIALTRPESLYDVRFASASSTSWVAPTKYGETVVWDGNRLRRYPAEDKEVARKRHRNLFIRAGLDADKILADDKSEVARLSLWAWSQLEDHVRQRRGNRLTNPSNGHKDGTPVPDTGADLDVGAMVDAAIETLRPGSEDSAPVPVPIARKETTVLPGFRFTNQTVVTEEGGGQTEDVAMARIDTQPVRQCDNCIVNERCPAMRPGHSCAFEFPVELRTRDQVVSLLQSVIEMQTMRVAFARYQEELEGGSIDQNVSVEIDRLMSVIKSSKDIQDNREFMRINVEARGGAGVISALFGRDAGEKARELPAPVEADEILHDVMDADIVD